MMNFDEEKAREVVRELEPFLMLVKTNGAGEADVPSLTALGVTSALLALVGEVRTLRETLDAKPFSPSSLVDAQAVQDDALAAKYLQE